MSVPASGRGVGAFALAGTVGTPAAASSPPGFQPDRQTGLLVLAEARSARLAPRAGGALRPVPRSRRAWRCPPPTHGASGELDGCRNDSRVRSARTRGPSFGGGRRRSGSLPPGREVERGVRCKPRKHLTTRRRAAIGRNAAHSSRQTSRSSAGQPRTADTAGTFRRCYI